MVWLTLCSASHTVFHSTPRREIARRLSLVANEEGCEAKLFPLSCGKVCGNQAATSAPVLIFQAD